MSADYEELERLLASATPGPWSVALCCEEYDIVIDGANPHDCVLEGFLIGGREAVRDANAALIVAAVNALPDLLAELGRLREALTPSGETKAAYIGEFAFPFTAELPPDGEEETITMTVPWTTIKEIMAAILARADEATPSQSQEPSK